MVQLKAVAVRQTSETYSRRDALHGAEHAHMDFHDDSFSTVGAVKCSVEYTSNIEEERKSVRFK